MSTVDSEDKSPPLISVGLAVYNGAQYLEEAVDSILNQSYTNFELIISDNASTDDTQKICEAYLKKDPRVHYYKNSFNLGAAPNFNKVFSLAQGEYFMWAAHDDVYDCDYLSHCIPALEDNPEVVLCFTQEVGIDDESKVLGPRPYTLKPASTSPEDRFFALLKLDRGSPPIFGLMRTGVLKQTSLIGSYDGSDQVLLAEISLYGHLYQIKKDLLLHREHSERSVYTHSNRYSAAVWFNTANEFKIKFPQWRWFVEYLRAIRRAPISFQQKVKCVYYTFRWLRFRDNTKKMFEDIKISGQMMLCSLFKMKKNGKKDT